MFVIGKSYIRRNIHDKYGGQSQGGISTPANYPVIFLFTQTNEEQYGYRDGWTKEGIFRFFGEGQRGDMTFSRGNKAVRDHIHNGEDLHLFEYISQGVVRYIDKMICVGFEYRASADTENKLRKSIIFELQSHRAFMPDELDPDDFASSYHALSTVELRQRALEESRVTIPSQRGSRSVNYREAIVKAYALRRAKGFCEGCGNKAPFISGNGYPYLEPHYIRRIFDGGPEDPSWVAALCPNCHQRAHYSTDKEDFRNQLRNVILEKEKAEENED